MPGAQGRDMRAQDTCLSAGSVEGRGQSKYKGPEVGASLEYLAKSKENGVVKALVQWCPPAMQPATLFHGHETES